MIDVNVGLIVGEGRPRIPPDAVESAVVLGSVKEWPGIPMHVDGFGDGHP